MKAGTKRIALALAVFTLAGCDKPAKETGTTTSPPAATVQVPPAAPAISSLARPTTQPGLIQPGDWLRVDLPELAAAGKTSVVYARVSGDGTVALPLVGPIVVGGLTTPAVEALADKAYNDAHIISQPHVTAEWIYLHQPGQPVPKVFGIGDLIRIDVADLTGTGTGSAVIHRIDAEGRIAAPVIGRVKIEGLSDAAAAAALSNEYADQKIVHNAMVTVTTLEQAPPDAAHLDLPDGPIYPVPEALRPVFER